MSRVITTLLFLLLFAVLSIALQIFLSTREAKWPGLVQPILWLGLPLLFVLSVAAVGDHPVPVGADLGLARPHPLRHPRRLPQPSAQKAGARPAEQRVRPLPHPGP